MDLTHLVPMLKAQGVKDFEGYGIKISFHEQKVFSFEPATVDPLVEPTPTEASAPRDSSFQAPDLRADDTMSEQAILEWSAGGDSIPLTGEQEHA